MIIVWLLIQTQQKCHNEWIKSILSFACKWHRLNIKLIQLTPFVLENSSEVWPLSSLQGGRGGEVTLELWRTSAADWQDSKWEVLRRVKIAPSVSGGAERLEGNPALRPTQDFLTGCHQGQDNNQYLSIDQDSAVLPVNLTSVHNIWLQNPVVELIRFTNATQQNSRN